MGGKEVHLLHLAQPHRLQQLRVAQLLAHQGQAILALIKVLPLLARLLRLLPRSVGSLLLPRCLLLPLLPLSAGLGLLLSCRRRRAQLLPLCAAISAAAAAAAAFGC